MYILYFITAIRCIHNSMQTASSTQDGSCGRKRVSACISDDMGGSKKCRYEDSTFILNDADVDEALSNWESNGMGYELLGSANVFAENATGDQVQRNVDDIWTDAELPELTVDDIQNCLGDGADDNATGSGQQHAIDKKVPKIYTEDALAYTNDAYTTNVYYPAYVVADEIMQAQSTGGNRDDITLTYHNVDLVSGTRCEKAIVADTSANKKVVLNDVADKPGNASCLVESSKAFVSAEENGNGTQPQDDNDMAVSVASNVSCNALQILERVKKIYEFGGVYNVSRCLARLKSLNCVSSSIDLLCKSHLLHNVLIMVIDELAPVDLIPATLWKTIYSNTRYGEKVKQLTTIADKFAESQACNHIFSEVIAKMHKELYAIDMLYTKCREVKNIDFTPYNLGRFVTEWKLEQRETSPDFRLYLFDKIRKRVRRRNMFKRFNVRSTKAYIYHQICGISDLVEKTVLCLYALEHQVHNMLFINRYNSVKLISWCIYTKMGYTKSSAERFRLFLQFVVIRNRSTEREYIDMVVDSYVALLKSPEDDDLWVTFLCYFRGCCLYGSLKTDVTTHANYFRYLKTKGYPDSVKMSMLQNRNTIWKLFGIK